jgi:hypothetical protein
VRYNSRNPSHFAASFPASEKERFALWKWISKNTAGHVRGQGWYSPKDQEIVIFYKTPNARMDAILAVADHGVQGRVRSDLVPMRRAALTKRSASAKTVTPHQVQDAAEKLGYYRTAEIVGPGGLSGASMAALVRLVEEASRKRNPYIPGDLHELDVRGLQSYTTQLGPGWSDRVRALKEQGLTHRDALAQVVESHFKGRKNPSVGAGKVTYIVSVMGPTGSESFPYYGFDKGEAEIALREAKGLPKGFKVRFMEWKHGASRPQMIPAGNRKNPFTGEGWSEHKAWLQEASKAEPKRVSSVRAQEIIAQARGRAKHGPWSDQIDRVITKGERKYISDVRDSLPGNTSFVDALVRIAQGRV